MYPEIFGLIRQRVLCLRSGCSKKGNLGQCSLREPGEEISTRFKDEGTLAANQSFLANLPVCTW